jgi:hypothetical protein
MTNDEIKSYFEKNAGSEICGHYKITQVETPVLLIHKKLLQFYKYFQKQGSFRLIQAGFLSFVTLCLLMTGCRTRAQGRHASQDFVPKKEKMRIAHVATKKMNDR